jgi:hypothetical protein
MVVNTDSNRLTGQTAWIGRLRKQLEGLRPPRELTEKMKARIISTVTEIVGHSQPGKYRIRWHYREYAPEGVEGVWGGELVSNEVQIEIVP